MNLADYLLLEHNDRPWEQLLGDWDWLLPDTYQIWLVNRFADLFLVMEDGTVHLLDTGAGTLKQVADSQGQFAGLAEDAETIANWLMTDAVEALVERGMTLGPDQCYSYKVPPGLGGEYTLANFEIMDLHVRLSLHGQLFRQAREMAGGTRVGEVRVE